MSLFASTMDPVECLASAQVTAAFGFPVWRKMSAALPFHRSVDSWLT